jgi:hypothetical protein
VVVGLVVVIAMGTVSMGTVNWRQPEHAGTDPTRGCSSAPLPPLLLVLGGAGGLPCLDLIRAWHL